MIASLTEVGRAVVPSIVIEATMDHLREAGRMGCEGMALWAGHQDGSTFHMTETIIPQQEGYRTEHGLAVMVGGDELHRINMLLYRNKLRLFTQIHSHPGHAYHSEMDDEFAITTALGSLSIVIPDFAERRFALDDCAAYRLTEAAWWRFSTRPQWRRLRLTELQQLIVLKG